MRPSHVATRFASLAMASALLAACQEGLVKPVPSAADGGGDAKVKVARPSFSGAFDSVRVMTKAKGESSFTESSSNSLSLKSGTEYTIRLQLLNGSTVVATSRAGSSTCPDLTGKKFRSGNNPDLRVEVCADSSSPGPNTTPGPNATPGPNTTPGPNVTPGPNTTPGPNVTPGPNTTPGPNVTPGPNTTPGPNVTPGPSVTPGGADVRINPNVINPTANRNIVDGESGVSSSRAAIITLQQARPGPYLGRADESLSWFTHNVAGAKFLSPASREYRERLTKLCAAVKIAGADLLAEVFAAAQAGAASGDARQKAIVAESDRLDALLRTLGCN